DKAGDVTETVVDDKARVEAIIRRSLEKGKAAVGRGATASARKTHFRDSRALTAIVAAVTASATSVSSAPENPKIISGFGSCPVQNVLAPVEKQGNTELRYLVYKRMKSDITENNSKRLISVADESHSVKAAEQEKLQSFMINY
ncbi:hypothetical protein A2U01_0008601, partial [Trifolium medium]|nr:hypothetical protein [Trifolium medium]